MNLCKLTVCRGRLSRLAAIAAALVLTGNAAVAQHNDTVVFDGDASSGTVITAIERQTDYVFVLDYNVFDITRMVKLERGPMRLSHVLDRLVAGTGFVCLFKDNYIILAKEKKPVRKSMPSTADGYIPPIARHDPAPVVRPPIDSVEVIDTDIIKADIPAGYSSYSPIGDNQWMPSSQPSVAVKTNLLYGAGTLTPNLAIEMGIGPRSTIEITGSWNPWNKKEALADYKQLMHWIVRGEWRLWLCERYTGHFFGAHLFGAKYNVSGYDVPLLFDRKYRYEGWAAGAGITYGYHLPLAKRWGLEFSVGVGGVYAKYDRYDCRLCATDFEPGDKFLFGPTRAGVSLVFLIK